jgi:hypothetical protein
MIAPENHADQFFTNEETGINQYKPKVFSKTQMINIGAMNLGGFSIDKPLLIKPHMQTNEDTDSGVSYRVA